MRQKKYPFAAVGMIVLPALLVGTSCSDEQPNTSRTGIAINMDVVGDTDVAGMRFDVTPVDCDTGAPVGDSLVVTKALEDILIPGGVPELEDNPLDADSQHVFADAFFLLAAGCYDVATTPLDSEGQPSGDCRPAFALGVQVLPRVTTEIFMINQCAGDDRGGLDIGSGLNHEPKLLDLYFDHSKFGPRCERNVVCATAADPDGDPLEFVWESVGPRALAGPRVLSNTDNGDGSVTECIELIPQEAGRYDIRLIVFDLLWDGGALIRIEDFLAAQGYPSESRTEITFPVYSTGNGREPTEEVCGNEIDDDCDFEVDENCEQGSCEFGRSCGEYAFGQCPDCAADGVCVKTAEGDPLCHRATACGPLDDCVDSTDCAPGDRCIIDSCCIGKPNVCVPASNLEPAMCDMPIMAAALVSEQTTTGL